MPEICASSYIFILLAPIMADNLFLSIFKFYQYSENLTELIINDMLSVTSDILNLVKLIMRC